MISLERLYSRQCPKSLNAEPSPRGFKSLQLDEVLNIIGQVQHHHPIGSLVLDVQIAQDKTARAKLVGAIHANLVHDGLNDALAFAMAEAAVHEVCDTCICPKCKGAGEYYNRHYKQIRECKRCSGVGRIIPGRDALYQSINSMLPAELKLTQAEFEKRHYDQYMSATDILHSSAGDAALFAKSLLRRIEQEWQAA
jgi:hypothetical protein